MVKLTAVIPLNCYSAHTNYYNTIFMVLPNM